MSTEHLQQPAEVATKVLRRAQVSKMTRTLQNRLALANVKIKHGWEALSLDALEPRVDGELKRKRPGSGHETVSEVSSTVSDRGGAPLVADSSPLAAVTLERARRPASGPSSRRSQTKRAKHARPSYPASSDHLRKGRHSASGPSWKSLYQLPESSPVHRARHSHLGRSHAPSLSLVSEGSTIADEPRSPLLSEDDDEDLPVSSFQVHESHMRSSPPRGPHTPPPVAARAGRLRGVTTPKKTGEEDANLLMYLAASPSPATFDAKHHALAPSTPPSKSTPLPSSMMGTPGGANVPFLGLGFNTPGPNINFSDFLNITPSPAQGAGNWPRTPGTARTPAAARDARRRLNFDSLVPPSGDSPRLGVDRPRAVKVEGLGMDLGGELVS